MRIEHKPRLTSARLSPVLLLAALVPLCPAQPAKSTAPVVPSEGKCSAARSEVVELDRQIRGVSSSIVGANTELQSVRLAAQDIAKEQAACVQACPVASRGVAGDCHKACDGRAQAAKSAGENKRGALLQSCDSLQQTIAALKAMRAGLAGSCSVTPRDPPASSTCKY